MWRSANRPWKKTWVLSILGVLWMGQAAQANLACEFTNITNNPPNAGGFVNLKISDDGDWAVFAAEWDPLGTNTDNNMDIFVVNLNTGIVTQVTSSPDSGVLVQGMDISGDGQVAFLSRGNWTGQNPDNSFELFLYDPLIGTISQLTDGEIGGSQSSGIDISSSGNRIAFQSRIDVTGENAGAAGVTATADVGFTGVADGACPTPP